MIGKKEELDIQSEERLQEYTDNLLKAIANYNPYGDITAIKKAIRIAYDAHKGQMRASGEAFIVHPLSVAKILVELKTDSKTICAGILHDVVEDTDLTIEQIKKEFGEEVANIVEGTTKIEGNFPTKEDFKAENIRKILLASAKDIRVMLVKLADRLHNMQTLKFFRPDKQERIAKETIDIYAPIAEKLGVWKVKGELEDLSLRYLEPEIYQKLKSEISEKREIREKKTQEYIKQINQELEKIGLNAEVYGRAKYFHSIYKKMKKYNKTLEEIYDLIAIRIIVDSIPDCYTALNEVILKLWKLKTGRLKDYIKNPKNNGYQSIHLTVATDDKKLLEIQIRTRDMHITAEDGIAAHWKYKETERDKHFDRKISWMKQVLDWKRHSGNAREFVENLKVNLFENEIVALTPMGDPISLPIDATPIDFAYEVHSNIGNKCNQAKINGKTVSLDTPIKPGDVVEIITKPDSTPSRQWLNFVKTSKAKSKIKNILGLTKERIIKENRTPPKDKKILTQIAGDHTKLLEVIGKKRPIKLSKCCNPKYGDPIKAFYTKDEKITVHKSDCSNIYTLVNSRESNIMWIALKDSDEVVAEIKVEDKLGLLAEILNKIAENFIKIIGVTTESEKNNQILIKLRMKKEYKKDFEKIIDSMSKFKGVLNIRFSNNEE
ncbi:bifunctional (p)ppGpp synthetase/guanosine-3',5'-bis(diphosphate) 3'-pyrophosphohydrolase [Candidatus Woesearchaeota archaeon]|nr:bifunctional (p)ppGpp synthetase/guanosine-3',5'-bis(diphosphate) 3'-pyrophosphohydrolase [Candidatus Woesearchaeota archaeon]